MSAPAEDHEDHEDHDAPDAVEQPVPAGPLSFRDFLGPVSTDAPAAPPAAGFPSTEAPAPLPAREAGARFATTEASSSPFPPTEASSPFPMTEASSSPFPATKASSRFSRVKEETEAPAPSASPFPSTGAPSTSGPSTSGASPFGPSRAASSRTKAKTPKPAKPAPATDEPAPGEDSNPAEAHALHKARRLAVPRLLDRRLALVAAAVLALGVGVGSGAVTDLLAHDPGGDVPPTTPQQCTAIQAAWTDSAAAQVGMTADDPATLVEGFLGARDALEGAPAPSGVAKDWAFVVTYLDTVAAAAESVDPADGAAVTAAVGAAIAGLDTPAVTEASARVTAYLKAGCPA